MYTPPAVIRRLNLPGAVAGVMQVSFLLPMSATTSSSRFSSP